MKTVQQLFLCTLLAALAALAAYSISLVRAATVAVAAVPIQLDLTRTALIAETRAQLSATRRDLFSRSEREFAALRTGTLSEAAAIRETADRRIGDTLARADTALGTVDALRRDLQPLLQHSAAVTAQVDAALPPFLDCDHNPDCAFNRYVGASKGIEHAATNLGQATHDISGALPQMLLTWNRIGTDISGTAGNLDRLTKPHWYDRLIGYGLNGVVIYRNLNPITNLTIKGAQTLSSRP